LSTPTRNRPVWSCRDCNLRWTSLLEEHCVVCCQHFTGTEAGDLHRRDGQCVDPRTAKTLGGGALFAPSGRGTTLGGEPVWSRARHARAKRQYPVPAQRQVETVEPVGASL
jgi:hypothetical protein